jgi:hypothetical protein
MIVGIAGRAGVGKDTVAQLIKDEYPNYCHMAFAQPIKDMLSMIDVDCTTRETKELPIPEFDISPRRMAQTLGTEWGRALHPDFWLIVAEREMYSLGMHSNNFVFSDVRFENEADFIRRKGGLIIHVRSDIAPAVEAHVSEKGIATRLADYIVVNNGTIEDLRTKIKSMIFLRGHK